MHKTLKADTCFPPAANLRLQQKRFDEWRHEFNHDRSHEALKNEVPASIYVPSPRPLPKTLTPIEYPAHFEVRRVALHGYVKWNNQMVNVTRTLEHEYIGFEEVDCGIWDVYFAHVKIGRFNEELMIIKDTSGNFRRKKYVT
jgi:putative transposase